MRELEKTMGEITKNTQEISISQDKNMITITL